MNPSSLAREIKVDRKSVDNYLKGSVPGADVFARLCVVLRVDANELLGIEGEYVPVKLYAAKASGGHGRVIESEEAVKELHFRRDWLASQGRSREQVGAVTVDGTSMHPNVKDGDVVLFDKSDTRIQEGAAYVVRVSESLSVKELFHEDDPPGSLGAWGRNDRGERYRFFGIEPKDLKSQQKQIVGRVFWRGGRA